LRFFIAHARKIGGKIEDKRRSFYDGNGGLVAHFVWLEEWTKAR
jgi:hypothetical protein